MPTLTICGTQDFTLNAHDPFPKNQNFFSKNNSIKFLQTRTYESDWLYHNSRKKTIRYHQNGDLRFLQHAALYFDWLKYGTCKAQDARKYTIPVAQPHCILLAANIPPILRTYVSDDMAYP